MSMPSQYSQLLLLLLLAAATHTTILAADQQQPIPPGGCPDDEKCGSISIPYPFSTMEGCYSDYVFQVFCDNDFNPPRAFLPVRTARRFVGSENYTAWSFPNNSLPPKNRGVYTGYVLKQSIEPIELVDISPSRSELRVYGEITSDCVNAGTDLDHRTKIHGIHLDPFLVSQHRNVLIGVGPNAEAQITHIAGISVACISYVRVGLEITGSCTGQGCCQSPITAEAIGFYNPADVFRVLLAQKTSSGRDARFNFSSDPKAQKLAPCSYSMLVQKSWYKFSSQDMYGRLDLPNKYPRGVPYVLNFAMWNGSCPAKHQQPPQDYACVSGNSYCANPPSGDGYVCRCWDNYDGNPYIPNGCQDINECEDRHLNNCSEGSICKNTVGGYECPCKWGMRGDGKEGSCNEIFTLPAKVSVGVAAFIVVIVLMVLAHQLLKLKKFYEQNGGSILEGVRNIRIYTSNQLKQMTNNYKVVIGEGHFGKVYMGTLKDKEEVAIKKTIKVDEGSKKDFIDEVIIQSGMRHKNIVRLLGCCLEMDVPMLMYEYVVKGSLYDVLFKSKANVPVDTRLRIAIGSAEGLAYMHSAGENTIRHGDVKSANILLDGSFTPKISDFGTSKLLARGNYEKTEWVTGDKAYIDPAYMVHGILTQKSDVYSFGIVLIELITRRVAKYDDNMSYVKNFVQACQDQRVRNFLDNDITSEKDIELLLMVSEVALECLKLDPEERLDMRQVENRLYIIGQSEQCGQETNFQGNLSPNMEVPFLKSVENKSPTN
ncbi:unnamed protein product [Alopecurus aequalis]